MREHAPFGREQGDGALLREHSSERLGRGVVHEDARINRLGMLGELLDHLYEHPLGVHALALALGVRELFLRALAALLERASKGTLFRDHGRALRTESALELADRTKH